MAAEPITNETMQMRVRRSTGQRIAEVVEVEGITTADLIDQLISEGLAQRHEANAEAIRALRKARERAAKLNEATIGGEG